MSAASAIFCALCSGIGDLHVLDWPQKTSRTDHQTPENRTEVNVLLYDAHFLAIVGIDLQIAVFPLLHAKIPTKTFGRTELKPSSAKGKQRVWTLARKPRRRFPHSILLTNHRMNYIKSPLMSEPSSSRGYAFFVPSGGGERPFGFTRFSQDENSIPQNRRDCARRFWIAGWVGAFHLRGRPRSSQSISYR